RYGGRGPLSRCGGAPPALADRALFPRLVRVPGAIGLLYGDPREPGIRRGRPTPARKLVHHVPRLHGPRRAGRLLPEPPRRHALRARSDPGGGRPRRVTLSPEARPQAHRHERSFLRWPRHAPRRDLRAARP